MRNGMGDKILIAEPALVVPGATAIGSVVITQIIGFHYIFGAFFAGAIVPRELRQSILDRLQVMTIGVLMPFFFMLTGLRTRIEPSSPVFMRSRPVCCCGLVTNRSRHDFLRDHAAARAFLMEPRSCVSEGHVLRS